MQKSLKQTIQQLFKKQTPQITQKHAKNFISITQKSGTNQNLSNKFFHHNKINNNLIFLNKQNFNCQQNLEIKTDYDNKIQQAQSLLEEKKYKEATDILYELEGEYQEQDNNRIKILNILCICEMEMGHNDSAKIFNEEAMNIYQIQKSMGQNEKIEESQYFSNLFSFARIFTVRANLQGRNREEQGLHQTLVQSQKIYEELHQNLDKLQSEDQKRIVRQELALILTKLALAQIRTQTFDVGFELIGNAMEIWSEVEGYKQKNSYKFTLITYGMIQVMRKNYEEGITILMEAKQGFDKETMKNYNMANLYLGSLCILAPVFKTSNPQRYMEVLREFDNALDLLSQNTDQLSQDMYKQYSLFKQHQLQPLRGY
ncbi:hypothetical protein PPERSA_06266 [Pseudocohnilembus persalinus]|uniref:Tetratricopeptide repeat protein n=1 Tax=Pseudocohnilembus persalinus TaxID=266149 RepID=A0A0V0QVK6_PSEPJ|nr:hypothetical protein PPERSA_06266 [Pseudocohnilembus persalinus]|eukprot:KRX06295.1 hypothetical protein PPERSA_06266 [Pseudocohnilembus persalinus]